MVGNNRIISIKISIEISSDIIIESLFANDKQYSFDNGDKMISTTMLHNNDSLLFDGCQLVEFLITFSASVASSVVGSYIYNAIHDKAKKIEIDDRRTKITEDSISQAIETIKELVDKNNKKE